MSFQALLNGSAQCGPSNPLKNLLKHVQPDLISSQKDHFIPTQAQNFSQLGNSHLPSSSFGGGSLDSSSSQNHNFLDMNPLRHELESINPINSLNQPERSQAWNNQFLSSSLLPLVTPNDLAHMEHSFRIVSHPSPASDSLASAESFHWTQEFKNPLCSVQPSIGTNTPASHSVPSPPIRTLHTSTIGHFPRPSIFTQNFPMSSCSSSILHPSESNSSGKIVELSAEHWEAEFAKIGNHLESKISQETQTFSDPQHINGTPKDSTLPDLKSELAKTTSDSQPDLDADAEFMKSLESTWKNLASNLNSSSLTDPELSAWEAQFGDEFLGPNLASDPSTNITVENVEKVLQDSAPYPFQDVNPYLDHPDPFQEGQRLIISGEPLGEAALAFEAACRRQKDRGEAWRMLGETQAADEKEQLAIKAFEKATLCDDPDGQAAWLSLAICWVNEGQENVALVILERWLMKAYPSISEAVSSQQQSSLKHPWERHSQVVEKFLQAARAGPARREGIGKEQVHNHNVDADVQIGLGVLFYSNSEYDHARDCFESALGVNPDDFLLWNRLGATLANSGKFEEAIGAYRKALELRPTFTRAIYNLGVSCLNIHCYKEAVEHLLAALSLHTKSASSENSARPLLPEGDGSEHLWYTLRRALSCLERNDLMDLAEPHSNIELFRQHGFDF